MSKKDLPDLPYEKVELDPESEAEIKKVSLGQTAMGEAILKKTEAHRMEREEEGSVALRQAFRWKSEAGLLETILTWVSVLLWLLIFSWAGFEYKQDQLLNLATIVSLFGFLVRPFLLLSMLGLLTACTALRLKLRGVYLQLGHGLVLANPQGKLFARVENQIHDLRLFNQIFSALTCIAAVTFGFSILGWEVAISSLGGTKGATVFYIVFGLMIYYATARLFELKDQ